MVRSQDSSDSTVTFGGGHTTWPGLKTEVDICLRSPSELQVNIECHEGPHWTLSRGCQRQSYVVLYIDIGCF